MDFNGGESGARAARECLLAVSASWYTCRVRVCLVLLVEERKREREREKELQKERDL